MSRRLGLEARPHSRLHPQYTSGWKSEIRIKCVEVMIQITYPPLLVVMPALLILSVQERAALKKTAVDVSPVTPATAAPGARLREISRLFEDDLDDKTEPVDDPVLKDVDNPKLDFLTMPLLEISSYSLFVIMS